MSCNNFVALKLLVVTQAVPTLSTCNTEYTIAKAKSFAGFFAGFVLFYFSFVLFLNRVIINKTMWSWMLIWLLLNWLT